MKRFKVGDKVKWRSQAAAIWKEKHGVIVYIVPAGKNPYEIEIDNGEHKIKGMGLLPRDHESYLVKVGRRFYLNWPRVCHLQEDR